MINEFSAFQINPNEAKMSKLLKGLNPSQQKAVTHETGPLLIIAGPGSGKTRTVVHSIAYAIENGVMPDQILAFSFTVKASEELRNRVKEIAGEEKGDLVNISTFHSFCRWVLRENIDKLGKGYARNFKALEENDQRKIVMNLTFIHNKQRVRSEIERIQSHKFPKPDEVLNFIKKCKAREISPSNAAAYAPDFQVSGDYAKIYESYEQRLKTMGWIDYESQQLFTDELFRGVPEVKAKWQDKFKLIFVDEYQDTDLVQYRVIKALAETRDQNLRVVGDDDQGIYGFRGADIQNILNFERDYPNAKVIPLGQNYRSTQRIVETSRALAEFNPDRREKELFTRNFEGEKVKYLHCENDEEEASTIATFIRRAVDEGGRLPSDSAVLYRTNKQAYAFKKAFNDLGIRYHIVRDSADTDTTGVSMMTIHKSKGLEFPNVFITGICKDLLPHYYNRDEKDWDEELRLLYVAMTRAKNWLCLSSYEEEAESQRKRGRSPFLERGYIPTSLLESIETLENIPIPPNPEEMVVQVGTEGATEYVEPLPEKLLGDGMTVLGIDPGIQNVGWSITQKSPIGYTVLKYGTQTTTGWQNTLVQTESTVNELIALHHPDAIAVEKLEGATEDWFLYVAGCVATIRSIADQHGIECHLYTPQHVKYVATGNRNACKEDVQKGVKSVCNLPQIPEPHHSADAIATSLCYLRSYLNSSRFEGNKRKQEHYEVGCGYLDKKHYEAAIDTFKETINIDPIYTEAHCDLARAYLGLGKLEEAENSAKEALRLDANYQPARALLTDIKQSHVNRGKDYLKKDELVEAENSAREARRLDPNCQETDALLGAIKLAYYNRGRNHLDNRRYDEAITAFKETINKYSSFIEAYCGLARAYLGQDKLIEAEKLVNEALRLQEDNQDALQVLEDIKQEYYERGISYLEQGDLVSAENLARDALRLGHQLAHDLLEAIKQAYYNRGCDHLENRRYDEAITAFRETINKYPSFTEAHCGLGWAYLGKDNLAMAGRSVRSAYELDPNSRPVLQLMEAIKERHCEIGTDDLNQGNLSAAEESVNEALRLDPNDPHYQPAQDLLNAIKQIYYNRGSTYLKQGDWDAAADSARNALRLDKNYLPARELRETIRKLYYDQGLDYIADRAFDKAVKSLQKAKDIDPNDKAVWSNLGLAYYWIDEYANTARCYRKVTDLDPKDKNAYSNLGNAYFWMGEYADAIEPLQKACAIDPNCEKFHYYLGRAQFELDRLEEAKRAAEKALEINPNYQPTSELLKKIKKRSHKIIRRNNPNMILIPAGEFQMGCDDRDAPTNEKPIHTVYLDDFYIDKYPVTNVEYKKFVDANPLWRKDSVSRKYHNGGYLKHWNGNNYPSGKANHPVVYVSWYAAIAYAQWVGKRLPTEAEWEKAARGDLVSQIYPWGNLIDPSKANYSRNVKQTTLVDDYPANNYGLYDMAGNVWEWCLDRYNEDFYVKSSCRNPFAGGTLKHVIDFFRNVKNPRVLRGGSWSVEPQDVRSSARTWKSPDTPCPDLGFRCVMTVTP